MSDTVTENAFGACVVKSKRASVPSWMRRVRCRPAPDRRGARRINGLMAEVIEDHIRMHVVDPAKDTERRRGAEELIEAVQSYLK